MPPKRKRPERTPSDTGRPSPHRPSEAQLAQHDRDDAGGRGRGRGSQRGSVHRRDSSANLPRNGSPVAQRRTSNPQNLPPSQTARAPPTPTMQPPQATTVGPQANGPIVSERHYDHLTDDRLRRWNQGGRAEIVAHGCQSRDDMDITELSNIFQEFINAVLEKKLDAKDAGACVREILGDEAAAEGSKEPFFAPRSLLLDSLSLILDIGPNQYQPSLRTFLQETGISVSLMRQVLDAPLLQQLGLIRDSFVKIGVRQATNLLYRQANYNLLREETEGYSKLITELYMTSDNLRPEVPQETFERVKALIGTFDLDVGRVLDVTLDIAASVLVKQYKFLLKFLRVSSWWPRSTAKASEHAFVGGLPIWATPGYPGWTTTEEDEAVVARNKLIRDTAFWDRAREIRLAAFFELGGRQITALASDTNPSASNDLSEAMAAAEKQWMDVTKTVPPSGNRVAAHLLGFKLLFYYSKNRDPTDVLPANLLYLAALLIKIGFISLPDLYPHLSPDDENMDKVRDKKMKEIEEAERKTRGGTMNALLMAGELPQGDDDNPNAAMASRKETPKKIEPEKKEAQGAVEDKDEPHEQKVSLLIQLLTIGALPESLFILGRFPWIPDVFPEVLDCIHRILHVSLSKVYEEARPVVIKPTECPTKNIPDVDQTGLPKGSVRLTRYTTKKTLRWPTADKYDHNDNQDYRYYLDEWTDNIPVCQTVDDVFTLCDTFLNYSGVNIGRDASLLSKLATIGSKSLHGDKSEHNMSRWKELLKRLLLPALSHTKANASTVDAVWNVLRCYPTTARYALYAEWFEGQISRLPAMKAAFARARQETRATMKRVSLTNLSEMAKRLAKTSYSSPGVVFAVAFEQLESYPNLIEAFVECAKYFTDLSYDVLIWSLLNSLGKSRSRTQEDHALTTSKWLQALSRFVGKVFRRYSVLNPVPVLSYVNDQLVGGNSTDLIILREFISSMGGIVDSSDFTDQQILSMAGGEYLRRQTLIRGQDRRFENIRSSHRLINALTETDLASQLLINLAQYRQVALFKVDEDEAHVKFLSSIVDESHRILIQYLDFVWSNVDPGTYDSLVPSIPDLLTTYGLDTSLAFLIGRASLSHRMFPWKPKETAKAKDAAEKPAAPTATDKEGDAVMTDEKATNGTPEVPEGAEVQKSDDPSRVRAALNPIIESVQGSLAPEVWENITPELYVTFWALHLGDLFCPEKMYRQESNRLKTEEAAIARDRSDMSRRAQERKMEKRKELMQLQIDLSEERSEHTLRQAKWKFHLSKQFQAAFPEPRPSPGRIADALLEHCFLPRILVSPADAEYTYRFIKSLHEWNAPGFKLMSLCDRLFNANRLRVLIFTSTVREAENVGRFLNLLLEDLSRWHKNEPLPADKAMRDQPRLGSYDKEGKGSADQPRLGFALTVDENGKPKTFVEHTQFKDMLFGWHKNLNTAIKSCLGGSEWMHIRNAITVLKCVLEYFPAIDFMGNQFATQLQNITKREAAPKSAAGGEEGHRVDLSVAAQGAMSELQRRKSKWMMVQAFRSNAVGGPQKPAEASDLRPTAPAFKPPIKSDARNPTTTEAEDGEVQDSGKPRPADSKPRTTESTPAEALPPKPSTSARDTGRSTPNPTPAPRSSTPKGPNQGPGHSGPRADPRANILPDRPPTHNLPSRPDVPIPGHYSERHPHVPPRGSDRRESREPRDARGPRSDPREPRDPRDPRESRDPREHRDPREGWPGDVEWNDRAREFPERRGPADNTREANRTELLPRHGAHERDRPHRGDARGGRSHETANDHPAPAGQQQPTPANQEPSMNPERAALFRQDGQDKPSNDSLNKVNPARAALIGDGPDNTPTRPLRDEARDRGSRPHSPRRASGRYGHHEHPQPEPGHDDRAPRPHPADNRPPVRPRERSPLPPSGYRGERPMDREVERVAGDRNREPLGFHRPASRGQEYDYRNHYDDQSYGRLNPIQSVAGEIPSGPRGRGRGARGGPPGPGPIPTGPDSRYGAHNPPPRPPSPERHPPTGPSGRNSGRRGYEPPTGPSTPSSAGPHHADRMRNFNGPADVAPPGSGVHPDRLAQMGGPSHGQQPPPPPAGNPPSHPDNRQPIPSTPSMDRSRNDRAASGSMMPNAPAPEGPERGRAGGSRRQLAGINNMLQANKPDQSRSHSRRNQPRTMLGNSDVQVLAGGSPVSTPGHERSDPMLRHHDSASKGPSNGDEPSGRDEHERSGRRDRESRSDRPSRSSRRSSRDRERERSPTREKESKDHRDYRDRRSGVGTESSSRDDRESRRSGRNKEPMAPPPSGGRESRHRGPPPKEGGTRGDERREDRSSRKRRSEGDTGGGSGGGPTSEREKRPRR